MRSNKLTERLMAARPATQATKHLYALDGLRGVAALCVLFLHAAELLNLSYIPPSAGLAVDFFFLLSGYVLAFAYDQKFDEGTLSSGKFALRRIVRLYPMLFLGTCLGVVVAMLGHTTTSPLLIMGSFLLIPVGFISIIPNAQAYPYNNPVWSLFFELIVNFIYGSPFGRRGVLVLSSVVAVSVICLVVIFSIISGESLQLVGFKTPGLYFAGIFRVSCSFWLGVVLFRLGLSAKAKPIPLWLALTSLLGALLSPISGPYYSFVAVFLIFPTLVVCTATTHISPLKVKICVFAGELSYPLYLLHQPVFRIAKNIPEFIHVDIGQELLFATGTLGSIVISVMSLYFIDIPVRRYITRVIDMHYW